MIYKVKKVKVKVYFKSGSLTYITLAMNSYLLTSERCSGIITKH